MAFDNKKAEFAREHIYIVEIDLDYCSLTFGAGNCVGGIRSITLTAVTVDDFSAGDEIEGATSGAVATIESVSGSSPTYTIEYRVTNGINFQTAAEVIDNNSNLGSGTKNGSAPTLITTGDGKCFNTLTSCQDASNYDDGLATPTTKTYRFCEDVSPLPINLPTDLDTIPSLKSVRLSPSRIDIRGGLGARSSLSLSFNDHPFDDVGVDNELSGRTYDPLDRGSFWNKLRARNQNYQYRDLRLLSGYLENGEYISTNFESRYFIIDKMNVGNGRATITAKDPLKLASSKKALAPALSTGSLNAGISAGDTSATLIPAGVGNSEYSAAGHLLINKEVIQFTRSGDTLTLSAGTGRGSYNTTAAAHAANDTVQECLIYAPQAAHLIVKDLLTTYANIDASLIPISDWEAEDTSFLNRNLSGIIVKPFDVWKLLKELAESMPHYLWWDDVNNEIQFTAIKPPVNTEMALNMDEHLILNSVKVRDEPSLRDSVIFVNFGQFDPTKKLDDIANYQQSHARIDTTSIAKYKTSNVRTINTRWIDNTGKGTVLTIAALIGRRFADNPRIVNFSLDAKDVSGSAGVWLGQTKAINYRDIVDFNGLPVDTFFQIISAREDKNYSFEALEFTYGSALTEDEGAGETGVDLLILSGNNINLRDYYDARIIGGATASTKAKFVVQSTTIIGSTATTTNAIETGTFPAGAEITLQVNSGGYVLGKGGYGGGWDTTDDGEDGGDAINMTFDLTLINNGIIGSGGGGGGAGENSFVVFGGGGGAGGLVGDGGQFAGYSGTTETGGAGGTNAGDGGDLNTNGSAGSLGTGGTKGDAINKNSNVLTETVTGDIRGAINA